MSRHPPLPLHLLLLLLFLHLLRPPPLIFTFDHPPLLGSWVNTIRRVTTLPFTPTTALEYGAHTDVVLPT